MKLLHITALLVIALNESDGFQFSPMTSKRALASTFQRHFLTPVSDKRAVSNNMRLQSTTAEEQEVVELEQDDAGVFNLTNEAEHRALLARFPHNLIVIKVAAPWCRTCKALAPRYAALAVKSDYKNIIFARLEAQDIKDYVKTLGITALPTILFYAGEDGKVEEFTCPPSKVRFLRQKLNEWSAEINPETGLITESHHHNHFSVPSSNNLNAAQLFDMYSRPGNYKRSSFPTAYGTSSYGSTVSPTTTTTSATTADTAVENVNSYNTNSSSSGSGGGNYGKEIEPSGSVGSPSFSRSNTASASRSSGFGGWSYLDSVATTSDIPSSHHNDTSHSSISYTTTPSPSPASTMGAVHDGSSSYYSNNGFPMNGVTSTGHSQPTFGGGSYLSSMSSGSSVSSAVPVVSESSSTGFEAECDGDECVIIFDDDEEDMVQEEQPVYTQRRGALGSSYLDGL